MSKTDHFFVYGTLKKGGHFAPEFDAFRVKSRTAKLEGFDLFNLGWFPGILPGNGEVVGEVHEYKSPAKVQAAMDRIEGYNPDNEKNSLYLRKKATVTTGAGEEVEANIYVFNNKVDSSAKKINDGVWDLLIIRS